MLKFNFSKEYILEDDFVKLSPLESKHIGYLSEISNEPFIWTYFLEKGNGIKNLTKYIHATIANRKSKKEYPFVVFDKIKKQYAGTTRFYQFLADLNAIKLGHTWYGKEFRATGLNKHCKYLLFEFAFEKIKVDRIGFGAYLDNTISIAAMKSVGCKEEGVLRAIFPAINGEGRADGILMSILKNEWNDNVKSDLRKKLNKTIL